MPKPMSMGHGRRTAGGGAEGGRPKADFSALGRAVKRLFVYYPRMAPLTMCCILFPLYATMPISSRMGMYLLSVFAEMPVSLCSLLML